MTKICSTCKEQLPTSAFRANKSKKDGLQSSCIDCRKEYNKQHYKKHKRHYLDKSIIWKESFKQWWKEYKSQFKCSRCSENHPACIHFHHLDKTVKENTIARLVGIQNKERLLAEIDKCIPLCANCHAKEHWAEYFEAGP